MNGFGIDITGYIGVAKLKPGFAWPKGATEKDRSYKFESGPGCRPTVGTSRKVSGRWLDGAPESMSEYAFEYLLDSKGKRVNRLPEPETDVDPVKLAEEAAPGLPSKEELQAKVRRKKS